MRGKTIKRGQELIAVRRDDKCRLKADVCFIWYVLLVSIYVVIIPE